MRVLKMRKLKFISHPTIIACVGLLALGGISAVAAGEGNPLNLGERNPSSDQTVELNRETEIIGDLGTYTTRQSNKSDNGGGAIYGCRSGAGGTPANNEPCVRGNNLKLGLAFEFESKGDTVGTFNAKGAGGDAAKPFTTNATGVATGLNAERVGSLDSEQVDARWVLVGRDRKVVARSDENINVTAVTDDNTYVNLGTDVTERGVSATLAVTNTVDRNGDNEVTAEDGFFTGQVAAGVCSGEAGFATCAPEGTNNDQTVVVRTTDSAGDTTIDSPFYVVVE